MAPTEERHEAEQRILQAEKLVGRQWEVVSWLSNRGLPAWQAREVLQLFERIRDVYWERYREIIRAEDEVSNLLRNRPLTKEF